MADAPAAASMAAINAVTLRFMFLSRGVPPPPPFMDYPGLSMGDVSGNLRCFPDPYADEKIISGNFEFIAYNMHR
jgi:hypothetical protein